MAVPGLEALMVPVLRVLAGAQEVSLAALRDGVAQAEALSNDDVRELLPSGRQTVFANRVSWALVYLGGAELVSRERRGFWRLTAAGRALAGEDPCETPDNLSRFVDNCDLVPL